ncbi:conserved hypothetical protein [Carnobacterium maltaromaticum]|uniref:Uncharacterized protein n=1 Tax=Carnobacterium maltaromaticum TaxID=2751 RepID=A0AAW9K7A4_CARML|nr:hypothetical protein [Carnobacterium maltaromaticum]MDZ5759287.1 hypothetical protein [Carnobacterium maltaromaticum]CAD5897170.1 conserved hypothetical protein [Carnobacterium maltaromaticum]CAD5898854.1 conserved hypothetical protein [Carnobacterium maltaromaticum]
MTIDDYWEDKKIYYISFLNRENKRFTRCIILPIELEDKTIIEQLIFTKFNRVKTVLSIDESEEGLLLKPF